MNDQAIDIEALAGILSRARIDPVRFEVAVREAFDNAEQSQAIDPLTGTDIRMLADALDINISYFDRFYREQNDALKCIGFTTRSFRNEAIGYQRVFARAVILNNILLGVVTALLLVVLGFVLFLAWPRLASGNHDGGFTSASSTASQVQSFNGPLEG